MRTLLRRALRKPAFALAVVATVAVAIGATTLIFTIVDGVLLAPLPFPHADRLVAVINTGPDRPGNGISPPDYLDWGERLHSLAGLAGWETHSANLSQNAQPTGVNAASVTPNWFRVLGIRIARGRGFAADEGGTSSPSKVVVLSYRLWHDEFRADPGLIGHTIVLDNERYVVVGVAAPGAVFPAGTDLWRPFFITPAMRTPDARGVRYLFAVGRLASGVTLERARRDVEDIATELHQQYPEPETGLRYGLRPLRDDVVARAKPALLLLAAAVGAIFLIASANVANLVIVRVTGQAREIAIRVALGSDRRSIARDIVSETILLSLVGGGIGIALAVGGLHAIAGAHLGNIPRIEDVTIGPGVILFGLGLTLVSGIAAGLGPALGASRPGTLHEVLTAVRSSTARRGTTRLRSALIVSEFVFAVPLLVAAGLLANSFVRLLTVQLGFRAEQVVRFDLTFARYQCHTHAGVHDEHDRPAQSGAGSGARGGRVRRSVFRETSNVRVPHCWSSSGSGEPAKSRDAGPRYAGVFCCSRDSHRQRSCLR